MVFEDPSRRRLRALTRASIVVALVALGAMAFLALGQTPAPRRTALPGAVGHALPTPAAPWREPAVAPRAEPARSEAYVQRLRALRAEADAVVASVQGAAIALPEGARVVFTVDDPRSHASLRAHANVVDVVSPDWFRVPGRGCAVDERLDDTAEIARAHPAMRVMPRVANLDGDRWTSAESAALLADPDARACLARGIAARVAVLGAHGVNVDFESLAPEDASGLVAFVAALRDALHPSGRFVTVDVAVGDPAFDLARLGAVADAVVLMAYDQHDPSGAPGPIASRRWVSDVVDRALALVPADKLVVALGAYAYDWTARPGVEAVSMSVPESFALAAQVGAVPRFVPGAEGTRFDYRDRRGARHVVWSLDATSTADSLAVLASRGVSRVGLWRAGTEDPSLWGVLHARTVAARARALRRIAAPTTPVVIGEGDVMVRRVAGADGARAVQLDASGRVRSAFYARVPTPAVVERLGGDASRRDVALTFDDGPDPRWTAAVLDVLRDLRAPGVFFVVGEQAMEHPELVRRATAEGHLVASHSFHHPEMRALDDLTYARELDRTARLLEALSGREVTLYRAPFTAYVDPTEASSLAAQARAFDRGYAYVAASVDPQDWALRDAARVAQRIVDGVVQGGRVVVLHDGGGDRQATVDALRTAVPALRARGYRFVGLDAYAGLSRAQVAPALRWHEALADAGAGAAAQMHSLGGRALAVLFTLCTLLAGMRIALLGFIVLRSRRAATPTVPEGFAPRVTVLVPAYNEAKVIDGSVRSLLRASYENLEVLVVDDGSTDDTAGVVERLAEENPRVRCVRKANGGKASAANVGLRHARGEIVVAVDADTVVSPNAIGRMVAHFTDPKVTAVCGNVEVGNVRSALTAFQAVEYVTSQNFDRRAFAELNCVGVVPGALGAWRRDAVLAVGGYSDDTLVEDADLTLTVLRAGGVITYEPRAVGRTEAPETMMALWKQRIRWTYGTYQCLVKHRGALLRGNVGRVAIPNLLLFQVLFPLVTPLGDLVMLWSLATGRWSALLSGYLGFLTMDLVASALAFRLDRKPMRWLALLLVQRFVYRPLLCAVSLKAMVSAAVGARQGWRKLDRTGTVDPTLLRPSVSPNG